MSWSQYHLDYQKQSEGEILQKAFIKKQELDMIFSRVELQTNSDKLKIAVLGCGDVRLIRHHREIFHDLFNKEIDLVTMDGDDGTFGGGSGGKKA